MTVAGDGGLSPGVEQLSTEVDLRRLQQVLVARFGWDLGMEAWQDATLYAWEHRERIAGMANPVGYLYRVAQTSVRRQAKWRRSFDLPVPPPDRLPDVEPKLLRCLAGLSDRQRLAVLLVHAHGWSHEEAATVLDVSVSTVRNHLRRGLEHLRRGLGVE